MKKKLTQTVSKRGKSVIVITNQLKTPVINPPKIFNLGTSNIPYMWFQFGMPCELQRYNSCLRPSFNSVTTKPFMQQNIGKEFSETGSPIKTSCKLDTSGSSEESASSFNFPLDNV